MAIKCPKCGADNMYNAIFCRQCGDKLDLASLKIEDQLGLDSKEKGTSKANQITGAVLLFAILALALAVLLPQFGAPVPEEPTEEVANKQKAIARPKEVGKVTLTSQELTDLLQKQMNLPKEGGEANIIPHSVGAICREDGTVKLVMRNVVFGFLPMSACAVIKPTVPEGKRGNLTLGTEEEPVTYSLGWLPALLPADVTEPFVEDFRNLANSTLDKIKRPITGVTVAADSITFDVAPGKKKPKKP